jgi:hypothetical protein
MGNEVVPVRPFSWGAFIGGCCVALFVGLVLNFAAGIFALGTGDTTKSVLLELIPGTAIAALSSLWWKREFGKGLLAGAAVVAIIGGLCGTTLSSGIR